MPFDQVLRRCEPALCDSLVSVAWTNRFLHTPPARGTPPRDSGRRVLKFRVVGYMVGCTYMGAAGLTL